MATRVPNAPNKVLRLLSSNTGQPIDPLLQQRQVIGIYDALDALAQSAFSVVNNVNTFTGSPLAYTTVLANATAVAQERNLNFSSAFSVVDNAPQARTDVALATTGVTPGAYGDSTHVGAFAVDATGRITAANAVAISYPTAGITQLTGDVTAGPGSGSVAAQVVQVGTVGVLPFNLAGSQNISKQNSGPLFVGTSIASSLSLYSNSVTQINLDTAGTVVNFPVGLLDITATAAPATPAVGHGRVYFDSTSKNLCAKQSGGFVAHGVRTIPVIASQWIQGIADDGTATVAQPSFADISGSLWTKTPGAIAFIDSTTHLVDNDPNNLFWDNTNKRVILGLGGAYTPAAGAPLSIWSSSGNIAIELDQAATQGIAKYNGSFPVGTGDANSMALVTNATHRLDLTATGGAKASNEAVSGGETAWKWDLSTASHTNVSAEVPDILANMSRLVTLTAGTIASMRAFRIDPVTYAGTGASVITDAATLGINGPPSTGAGATITNKWTLWSQGGAAKFDAPFGGTSAVFSDGGVNSTLKITHGATNRVVLDAAANTLVLRAGLTDMLTVNGASFAVAMPVLAPGSQQSLLISPATGQIQAGLVTNAMLATVPAFTFKGNNTGSTASPVDMTPAQAASTLPAFSSTANGTVPNPGASSTTNFLRADGTWAVPGSLVRIQTFTASGTYTRSAGVNAAIVQCLGGGGGGGGVATSTVGQACGGSGGAGGGLAIGVWGPSTFGASPPALTATLTITIGAGGAGGASGGGTGSGGGGTTASDGTNSITGAGGGGGGFQATGTSANMILGGFNAIAGIVGSPLLILDAPGGNGLACIRHANTGTAGQCMGGGGGSAGNGAGCGLGTISAGSGASGVRFGMGGDGALSFNGSAAAAGGNGAGGKVIVYEYAV